MTNKLPASPFPILFVDHAERLGGAEHSVLLLMTHLDRTLWQPHLACPPGDLAEAARQLGVPWHNVHLPRLRGSFRVGMDWYRGGAAVAEVARQTGAKVIAANTVRAAFYSALAARLCKRPFLWHMRDFWLSETAPRYPQVDMLIKKMLCRSADLVLANSQATASHLPCHRVDFIHNGIDLQQFPAELDGTAFRQAHDIPPDVPLIGIVGRLRPWKGQHRFISMAAAVAPTHPHVHYLIVGGSVFSGQDNGYANYLQELAQRHHLSNRLHFTDQIRNVAAALAAINIFVHSGNPEPFGLVNIEAMAMEKPVVAFAHGALPEIVINGETGILVPPTQTAALATAVISLLNEPAKAKKMGQAGRKRVTDLFTIQKTASRFSATVAPIAK